MKKLIPLVFSALAAAQAGFAQPIDNWREASGELVRVARAQARRAPAAPAAGASVDLSRQIRPFGDPPDQDEVGDCSVFASVAVLDAAYYRQYRVHLEFSAADLFIGGTLLRNDFHPSLSGGPLALEEASWVDSDLRYALENGVATEENVPYSAFLREYLPDLRAENKRDMQEFDRSGLLTKLANLDQLKNGGPLREAAQSSEIQRNQERVARLIERRFPEIVSQRAGYQRDFQRAEFEVVSRSYPCTVKAAALFPGRGLPDADLTMDELVGRDCRALGVEQKKFLLAELDAGRPVAAGINLTGMKRWGVLQSDPDGGHSLVIDGYKLGPSGTVFQTFNSWGKDNNYPVDEDELCRIDRLDSVRVSADAR